MEGGTSRTVVVIVDKAGRMPIGIRHRELVTVLVVGKVGYLAKGISDGIASTRAAAFRIVGKQRWIAALIKAGSNTPDFIVERAGDRIILQLR